MLIVQPLLYILLLVSLLIINNFHRWPKTLRLDFRIYRMVNFLLFSHHMLSSTSSVALVKSSNTFSILLLTLTDWVILHFQSSTKYFSSSLISNPLFPVVNTNFSFFSGNSKPICCNKEVMVRPSLAFDLPRGFVNPSSCLSVKPIYNLDCLLS